MWFIALMVVVLVLAALILLPLFGRFVPWQPVSISKAVALLQGQREQVMRKLKDLEGEHEAESIGEEQYQEMRKTFLTEAALLGRRIDALQDTAEPAGEGSA